MKACVFSLALFCLSLTPMMAQKFQFQPGWRFTAGYASQVQDRRLFGLEGTILAREILKYEEQNYSYDLSFAVHRSLLQRGDFRLDAGLGYRHEFNNFGRPFNHPYFTGRYHEILRTVRRYQVHQAYLPLSLQVRVLSLGDNAMIFLGGSLEGSIHFAKTVRATSGAHFGKFTAAPYSLEISPGIGLKVGLWSGMASYRWKHYRQWDHVIFDGFLYPYPHGRTLPTGIDTYNPTKLWFTVSRDLEDGWWRKEQWPKWRGK